MTQGSVCLNIGPRERKKRLSLGIFLIALNLGIAFWLARCGAPAAWRLALFFPYFMGALGVFQAKEKTCVFLAAQGAQNLDDGIKKIQSPDLSAALRKRTGKILIQSAALAAALTLIGFFRFSSGL